MKCQHCESLHDFASRARHALEASGYATEDDWIRTAIQDLITDLHHLYDQTPNGDAIAPSWDGLLLLALANYHEERKGHDLIVTCGTVTREK